MAAEKENGNACGIGRNENFEMERRSQEEVEVMGFVPSAENEPLCALHLCDNGCMEQGFKYFQIAAIVSEEGGAVHTFNVCTHCYKERRVKRGEQPVKAAQWREMMEQEAHRDKLWKVFGTEQFMRGMGDALRRQKSMDQSSPGGSKERSRKACKVSDQWNRHSRKYWSRSRKTAT